MTQQTLFELHREELTPQKATEQERELRRVSDNIAETIMDFLYLRGVGGTFKASELHQFVIERHPNAPASADRILRDLRQKERVKYSADKRSNYRIEALGE